MTHPMIIASAVEAEVAALVRRGKSGRDQGRDEGRRAQAWDSNLTR